MCITHRLARIVHRTSMNDINEAPSFIIKLSKMTLFSRGTKNKNKPPLNFVSKAQLELRKLDQSRRCEHDMKKLNEPTII